MSFEVAPAAYEAFMGRWSRRLAPRFVDFAGPPAEGRILDVGCGTGALVDEVCPPRAEDDITALDPSTSFVAELHGRLPRAVVVVGHAEQLPFADRTHGAALAQLVVHFMEDPGRGLAEMRRVTRPRGVVAACVWDFAGDRGPLGVFWEVVRSLDPDVPGEAHLPGTHEGELAELLVRAGLEDVTAVALEVSLDHADFEQWWQPFTRGAGPAGAYVTGLTVRQRQRLRRACQHRLPDGPIRVTAAAWAARGVGP